MIQFNTCNNGHNYDAQQFDQCPYCPKLRDDIDYKQTLSEFKSTLAMTEISDMEKTMIDDELSNSVHQFGKTQLIAEGKDKSTTNEKRKLIGWLVSFSVGDYGKDYKLFEGKNKIGSATTCDIVIENPSVSGEHATIFWQANECLIRDDFSTNGTIVNRNPVTEIKLKDGDELELGSALFKFKSLF